MLTELAEVGYKIFHSTCTFPKKILQVFPDFAYFSQNIFCPSFTELPELHLDLLELCLDFLKLAAGMRISNRNGFYK